MKKSVKEAKKNKKKSLLKIILKIIVIFLICLVVVSAIVWTLVSNTVKKPAIYLYPTEDSIIDVHLNINGKITKDIPDYGVGWKVFATKEGIIDGKYDYLFYEARLNKLDLPEEGWIVKYSELEKWLDDNLGKLGLNEKESSQFKEYWIERLPKSNYYEIKLLSKEYLDENMALNVNPEPDTIIRLEFYFKPLKEFEKINEPTIVTPIRQGFTVVEWGGILDK